MAGLNALLQKLNRDRRANVKRWREKVDRHIRKAKPNGRVMTSCLRGCSGCCYQLVLAHVYEGALIWRKLATDGELDLIASLVAQGEAQMELLLRAGWPTSKVGYGAASSAWMDRAEGCALLFDNECIVYGLRPIACSSHLVVSDPEQCGPPSGKQVAMVGNGEIRAVGVELERRLMQCVMTGDAAELSMMTMPLGLAAKVGGALLLEGPDSMAKEMKTILDMAGVGLEEAAGRQVGRKVDRDDPIAMRAAKLDVQQWFSENASGYPADAALALHMDADLVRDICSEMAVEGELAKDEQVEPNEIEGKDKSESESESGLGDEVRAMAERQAEQGEPASAGREAAGGKGGGRDPGCESVLSDESS